MISLMELTFKTCCLFQMKFTPCNFCYVLCLQTIEEYLNRESEYLGRPPLNISVVDDLSPVCYDAMYTFAYALNNTINGKYTSMKNHFYEMKRDIGMADYEKQVKQDFHPHP